jgi:hypothetical protein
MNLWPFRSQPKKPQWTVHVHGAAQSNIQTAAAWTVYAGTKALVRMGKYIDLHPESLGRTSPFDEECFARDALAEHWAMQAPDFQRTDPYLHLLVQIRSAGLIREYVWRFLREDGWGEPNGIDVRAFDAWAAKHGLDAHQPVTLAWLTPG